MRYAARLVRQGTDAQVRRGQLLAAEYSVELEDEAPSDDDSPERSESDYEDEDSEWVSGEEAEDVEWECESDVALIDASDDSSSESDEDESEPESRRR
jgi:hypothetical protein